MSSQNNSAKRRRRYYPPKQEINQAQKKQDKPNDNTNSHEFNSYSSRFSYLYSDNLYNVDDLVGIVTNPMLYNSELRDLSLRMYASNGSVRNSVDYMTAMPTLERVVIAHNDNPDTKKKNKEKMLNALRMCRDKEIVRDALFKGMLEGVAFYYVETKSMPSTNKNSMSDYEVINLTELNEKADNADVVNINVIVLPAEYTKIVGIKNSSYVLAFNLKIFTESLNGETIEQKLRKYPEEIRTAYFKWESGKSDSWVVLDNNHTIAHKIGSKREEPWGRPITLAAIKDIVYADYFGDTKRHILDDVNNNVVYQTFPEGQQKGSSILTEPQQKKQHAAVRDAVINKNTRGGVSFISLAPGTKINQLDVGNTDILESKYESDLNDRIALDLGLSAALLNGSGSGSYSVQNLNLELVSAQLFQWIEQLQSELNKCLNALIIKDSKSWTEVVYLNVTHTNKKDMGSQMQSMYTLAGGSVSLWAAAVGVQPEVLFTLLDQEYEDGVYEKYSPHQTSYTMSGQKESSEVGRPETDTPSENTIKSRNSGANNAPRPST